MSQNEQVNSNSDNNAAAGADHSVDKKKIAIGSQRDVANKELHQSLPKPVRDAAASPALVEKAPEPVVEASVAPIQEGTAPVASPAGEKSSDKPRRNRGDRGQGATFAQVKAPVPVPSRRLRDDDSEIDAAMAGLSMDQVVSGDQSLASNEDIEIDSRVKAKVNRIHNDDVFLSLKGRFEGITSLRSFKTAPEIGSEIEVVVKSYNTEDGFYEVHVPGAALDAADWSSLTQGVVVEAKVTGSNSGGLECLVNNIKGFIPISQIAMHRIENLEPYLNTKMTCVVTECNPGRKNLVLSHRVHLEKQIEELKEQKLKTLEVGSVVEGTVTRLMDFGVFVDIGGIEGLVHISKLSWERIKHPKDVFSEGDKVKVKIEKVTDEGKISLSYRDTIQHPWDGIEDRFPKGSIVRGTVTRLADFGAFVKIAAGIEGLVHISELAHHRVVQARNVVKEGEEIDVKVLDIDRDKQKLSLSLKATLQAPEKKEKEVVAAPEIESTRPLAVKKHDGPLKGGTSRPSGGDKFGLKW